MNTSAQKSLAKSIVMTLQAAQNTGPTHSRAGTAGGVAPQGPRPRTSASPESAMLDDALQARRGVAATDEGFGAAIGFALHRTFGADRASRIADRVSAGVQIAAREPEPEAWQPPRPMATDDHLLTSPGREAMECRQMTRKVLLFAAACIGLAVAATVALPLPDAPEQGLGFEICKEEGC